MKQSKRYRQIASHELITPEGKLLTQQVVLLDEGYVVKVHPLDGEQAHTEWFPGRITLQYDGYGIRAYYQGKQL